MLDGRVALSLAAVVASGRQSPFASRDLTLKWRSPISTGRRRKTRRSDGRRTDLPGRSVPVRQHPKSPSRLNGAV